MSHELDPFPTRQDEHVWTSYRATRESTEPIIRVSPALRHQTAANTCEPSPQASTPALGAIRSCSHLFGCVRLYRGAQIRTGDLTDPNGARYQAAPRPDASVSIPHRSFPSRPAPAGRRTIAQRVPPLSSPTCPRPRPPPRSSPSWKPCCSRHDFRTTAPTACRSPARPRSPRSPPAYPPARSCSSSPPASRQSLLVHHGLFWGSGTPGPIDAQLKRRLQLLFDADIALAAYHLPLDAHPQLGNNALLATALGAQRLDEPFALHHGEPIGCLVRFQGEDGDGLAATDARAYAH